MSAVNMRMIDRIFLSELIKVYRSFPCLSEVKEPNYHVRNEIKEHVARKI